MNNMQAKNSALLVIPARAGSTRFPNKPLAEISRLSMIERVWKIGRLAKKISRVVIATDSPELCRYVESFGAEALLTSDRCRTGTDRVGEVLEQIEESYQTVVNLQGDAVLTPPWVIDRLVTEMEADTSVCLATPCVRLDSKSAGELMGRKRSGSTSGTLVVFDKRSNALYFSKAFIPNYREGLNANSKAYLHVGLYAYRPDILLRLIALEETELERAEKLEQLRALEYGIPIRVVEVDLRGRTLASVDYPEDVERVEAIISREGELWE